MGGANNGSFHAGETSLSGTVEWYTPRYIFAALGLVFDLDPCASEAGDHVPALARYTKADDGLSRPWRGTVWLNPPYSPKRDLIRWLSRLARHGDGIALVFARTDARWFQAVAPRADLLCFTPRIAFVQGRARLEQPPIFEGPVQKEDGKPAGSGSVLLAYGGRCAEALARSGLGICMKVAA